jgi:AraC-like DNA-binding protein
MIDAIIREHLNQNLYSKEIITQLINTIIVVVARNIAMFLPAQVNECSEDKSLDILQYIQANIYKSGKVSAKDISQHFGISVSYVGRYIKKHTNETMQQYTLNYKLKLVESRLLHSQMRISEIVAELGFTDESHLNKFFKKYRGCTPSHFRKRCVD